MGVFEPGPVRERVELANEPEFFLGELKIKPAERLVIVNGEQRELQPRVMQVLIALAKARPQVVSRFRLFELCWDGRVVGDDALNRCILALRHLALGFTPHPFIIETVPRVGHRLLVPEEGNLAPAPSAGNSRRRAFITALALMLVVAAALLAWQQRSVSPEPASIAVLPFRTVGTGDPYFAEGISEEILGQLASEPNFRVAGNSSSSEIGRKPNVNEVAQRLNIDYVLEGSVRREGDRVRVSAGLVRTSDGIRLWSDSYDGKLDDVFAIQQRISSAIAGALKRRLIRTPALSGPLVTNGEAYKLYLTARGLIRTGDRRVGGTATALLRDAINIDPNYAPVWATLAEATQLDGALKDRETYAAAIPKAQSYARHALGLAPNLAEAHLALGMALGYGDPEGVTHLRRAAHLNPNSAEILFGLGGAHDAAGEFDQELAAYQKARGIDPLWPRTVAVTAYLTAEMGKRAEAESMVRSGLPNNSIQQQLLLGRIAWIFGDFSEAARLWSIVAKSNSPRWRDRASWDMKNATFAVGLGSPPNPIPQPFSSRSHWRAWVEAPPGPTDWQAHNRDPVIAEVYRAENIVAAKLMLNAGRAAELAALYDGKVGLLGLRPRQSLRIDQIDVAPVVALSLRQIGRVAEADRLLHDADLAIHAVYRRSRVPFWFDAAAAAVWASQGKRREALAVLERAIERGWTYSNRTDLRDIIDEPAFRSLHGDARFERLRLRLAAHMARERKETQRLLI